MARRVCSNSNQVGGREESKDFLDMIYSSQLLTLSARDKASAGPVPGPMNLDKTSHKNFPQSQDNPTVQQSPRKAY